MSWRDGFARDPVDWLLEPEPGGTRHLALRDLLGLPEDDPEARAARATAHREGPIAAILDAMHPDGYWVAPGPGYNPKYRSTVWSLVMLAQLGASAADDPRVGRACAYALDHALAPGGQFSASGAPAATADCLQGNLCEALVTLGCDDPRLARAHDWMARSVTGEGIAPSSERTATERYYAAGKCGPLFACASNDKQSCAWGAAKVMSAFSRWPAERRTPAIERAIAAGAGFLLGVDPATAAYPNGYAAKPSGNWWRFGFPVFYLTDILQIVEALAGLGYGRDPRLANALALVREKGGAEGRWALEHDYAGKTWVDLGPKKQASKWVTLRALRALKAAGE